MHHSFLAWGGFNLFILFMLAIDLGVFHKKDHVIKVKEALIWSGVWITLSLSFNVLVYFWYGQQTALEFLTGYLIEKSLSVDNIFVFALLFTYFDVAPKYQHKVLFWGILGALVMRGALIAVGTALISRFHFVLYIFGAFLVYTGIKMAFSKGEAVDPSKNPIIKLANRFLPITKEYHGSNFFVRIDGKRMATPLLVVLLVVEVTDLVFAVDSIPAVFGITLDPFIVYTSNVFAILGLRALYFALSGILEMFDYLKYGLALVLSFVGVKMLIVDIYHINTGIALGIVALILTVSIIISILKPVEAAVLGDKTDE